MSFHVVLEEGPAEELSVYIDGIDSVLHAFLFRRD